MLRRGKPLRRRLAGLSGRLTPAGWVVMAMAGFTSAVGLDLESSLSYQTFCLSASALALAAVFSLRFRPPLQVSRHLPRFGTAGEPVSYTLRVRNQGARVERDLSASERIKPPVREPRPSRSAWRPSRRARSFTLSRTPPAARLRPVHCPIQPLPDLSPGEECSTTLSLTPLRRGVLEMESVAVSRTDPFGLLRTFARFPLPERILVLPRRYRLPEHAMPGGEQYQAGGVAQASSIGRSEEFVSLRDYRRGDPQRHIHWRSWARAGKPIVKEFEDEFFMRHGLVLDTFDDPEDPEPFEEAVSLAASYACTLRNQESLLDLMFVGTQAFRFTAGRGLAHTDQLLEVLASAALTRDQPFETLSSLVLEHASCVTGCVLVLLQWDARRRELASRLMAMGVPLQILIVRPRGETTPPSLDPVPLEAGRFLLLNAGSIQEGLLGARAGGTGKEGR